MFLNVDGAICVWFKSTSRLVYVRWCKLAYFAEAQDRWIGSHLMWPTPIIASSCSGTYNIGDDSPSFFKHQPFQLVIGWFSGKVVLETKRSCCRRWPPDREWMAMPCRRCQPESVATTRTGVLPVLLSLSITDASFRS